MDVDLLWPEERELRELIVLAPGEDGEIVAVEKDPARCNELRRIIEEKERHWDDLRAQEERELMSRDRRP